MKSYLWYQKVSTKYSNDKRFGLYQLIRLKKETNISFTIQS